MRTASPSLVAVCRQSSGCRLPFLYCLLRWSVMSVYIGNGSLSVWWEAKTCRWNPASTDSLAEEEGNGCFLEPSYVLCRAGTWLWAQTLLSALTEGQGSGMCWYRRIAPMSKTVISTEQLGVLKWRPVHLSYCYLPAVAMLRSVCGCSLSLLAGCVPRGGWGSTSLCRAEFRLWTAADGLPRNAARVGKSSVEQHFSEMPGWAREVPV